jgi:hypothetical protein
VLTDGREREKEAEFFELAGRAQPLEALQNLHQLGELWARVGAVDQLEELLLARSKKYPVVVIGCVRLPPESSEMASVMTGRHLRRGRRVSYLQWAEKLLGTFPMTP